MPTFIEVCSGAGGLSTGLMMSGYTPLLLNDVDKHCCNTLRNNHPNVPLFEGSMCDLILTDQQYQDCDLLAGGVPCQSFSHAGLRKGLSDPRGQLIVEFKRLLLECSPKMFLIENVKGLVSHNGGQTLKDLIAFFQEEGKYDVKYKVLNAYHYGVPQKRERVLIVGVRSDIRCDHAGPCLDGADHAGPCLDGADHAGLFPTPISEEDRLVLKDVLHDVPSSVGQTYPERKRQILDMVPPGGCWINLSKEIQEEYMGAMLKSGGGKRGVARRLKMEEPCLTLTTSPAQKQTERCHPIETRPFTVREYARIQTFDDSYEFSGSMNQQYRQIGNAVPVRLAYVVGITFSKAMSKTKDDILGV